MSGHDLVLLMVGNVIGAYLTLMGFLLGIGTAKTNQPED